MDKIIDELDWEKFRVNSNLSINNLPDVVQNYNRLICHTSNFFVISGFGAFTEGYLLIIPKKLIPSFASLEKNYIEEFLWLKNFLINSTKVLYGEYDQVVFEHGMCACMGGLDRAHLHLMNYKN